MSDVSNARAWREARWMRGGKEKDDAGTGAGAVAERARPAHEYAARLAGHKG